MSRNVFRLNSPVHRPNLSWSSAPQARESLMALTQWLLKGSKNEAVQVGAAPHVVAVSPASQFQAAIGGQVSCAEKVAPKARPPHLKVVMVRDAQNPLAPTPARLVISGRMADVCAELDRLAA